jgi:hypothetical protein
MMMMPMTVMLQKAPLERRAQPLLLGHGGDEALVERARAKRRQRRVHVGLPLAPRALERVQLQQARLRRRARARHLLGRVAQLLRHGQVPPQLRLQRARRLRHVRRRRGARQRAERRQQRRRVEQRG